MKIVSDKHYTQEKPSDDFDQVVKRRGHADKSAVTLQSQLSPRNENTPIDMGTDKMMMNVARGMGCKLFENPVQLAASLQGFEAWCVEKNVVPSFVGMAMYLNTSKSELLNYMKSEQTFAVTTLTDAETGEYVFSSIDQDKIEKFADSHFLVRDYRECNSQSAEDSQNSSVSKEKCGSTNLPHDIENDGTDKHSESSGHDNNESVREAINNGEIKVTHSVISYQDVFAPMMNLFEQSTLSKGYNMRNPALAIFQLKNHCGATMHYTDRQEISVEATQSRSSMTDAEIMKAVELRPHE